MKVRKCTLYTHAIEDQHQKAEDHCRREDISVSTMTATSSICTRIGYFLFEEVVFFGSSCKRDWSTVCSLSHLFCSVLTLVYGRKSRPCIYGRSGSGMTTPSGVW
jgi:hypothetical protein